MKKIIAGFDGLKYRESTLKYALELARHSDSNVAGVFLEDHTYHSYRFADVADEEGAWSDKVLKEMNQMDQESRDQSVKHFEESCQKADVEYMVHRDRNIALHELVHESIYSDLLIIENRESFNRYEESVPTVFMQELLMDVQCPVLVVPDFYSNIEKVVILYDGEPSSVYAVKMFSYLIPSLRNKKVEVLTVKNKKEPPIVPDKRMIREFMKMHYPQAEFIVVHGDPEAEIIKYLQMQQDNIMVVLGAYRRSRVSRWFRPSMADALMADLKMPLFIAHNK